MVQSKKKNKLGMKTKSSLHLNPSIHTDYDRITNDLWIFSYYNFILVNNIIDNRVYYLHMWALHHLFYSYVTIQSCRKLTHEYSILATCIFLYSNLVTTDAQVSRAHMYALHYCYVRLARQFAQKMGWAYEVK